ncbi:MAG: DUF2029 domain-containing protein [Chloroflexia bacterium]|nr:DUF2029 domain-containing protein [Chloroflexia bacterium]
MKVSTMPRPIANGVYLLYGALILVGLVSVVRYLPLFFPPAQYDFRAYYAAGYAVIHHLPIYEKHLDYQALFLYMPVVALFFAPIAWLPLPLALWLWYGFNLVVLGGWVWLLTTHIPLTRWQRVAVIATALVLPASVDTLLLGQITHVLMLGIVATLVLWRRGYHGWAGVVVGVLIIIKAQLVMMALLFLWQKEVRGALAALITVMVGVITSAWVFGWDTVGVWVRAIQSRADYSAVFPVNQSLNATITRFFVPQLIETSVLGTDNVQQIPVAAMLSSVWLAQWLVVAGIVGLLWYSYRRMRACIDVDLQMAVLLPIMLLVMPLSWDSYMVYLLWPIALLWSKMRHTRDGVWLIMIVGCMLGHRFWRVLVLQWPSPLLLMWGCIAVLCCWWALMRIGNRSAGKEVNNGTP